MIVIIAGDRDYENEDDVFDTAQWVHDEYGITHVVSGHARGVDKLGEAWAKVNKIPCKVMPADWENLGQSAGHIRNRAMADWVIKECAARNETSGLIAFLRDGSRGTKNMVTTATSKGFDFILSLRIEA